MAVKGVKPVDSRERFRETTRSMAVYYAARTIRVNVIAPGLARTPASERSEAGPELSQFLKKKQPLTEAMFDAVEVVRAAVFLLGDDARQSSARFSRR